MFILILVDNREPQTIIDNAIERFGSKNVKITTLQVGLLLLVFLPMILEY